MEGGREGKRGRERERERRVSSNTQSKDKANGRQPSNKAISYFQQQAELSLPTKTR